jgi:hypothetical protein
VSTDEKTGIQALERKHPDIPMKPGKTCLREYEYIRHGTLCLLAARDVGNGAIVAKTIQQTRKEQDFLKFTQKTVATDPNKEWVFIADQLNTHVSASLVQWIAGQIQYTGELGIKGKSGILKSMVTRKAFLEDEEHDIRFLYTPKHCSWLNQIEVWFSTLSSQVITQGDFKSKKDLEAQLHAYIDYYNKCMAKPYNWKYSGDNLCYVFNS